ncbi:MAG: DUF2828 family protein [Lachnospiraceae bacterium]|nr:DUF2828 family protein [Lachnospiraceae bacterium]MDY2697983.1 DUF2828 family protein [Lachnospiraceae bacterium]MDY5520687.1 DUF2828 family protein [Agathobacter sp.]
MTFMSSLENQIKHEKQLTENGASGYTTSGKELLNMNFSVGSMRNWSGSEIVSSFIKAYYESPFPAVKWLFYLRDIRGCGMGERRVFRVCFKWLVENHFDYALRVIELIPEYGRFDDWICLLDTKAKNIVISKIKEQLGKDICSMESGEKVSLLAKWLPSCNTSSESTRNSAKIICNELGLTEKEYRKTLAKLRSYLQVVEVKMTAKNWSEIDYSILPSRANLIYGNAFLRNDEARRRTFLKKLNRGEVKINADTIFPSDIVTCYYEKKGGWRNYDLQEKDDTLEGLWKALPNCVSDDSTTLVVRDGSGSMDRSVGNTSVTALDISTALAIYFAEHCKGQFLNKFITFSSHPQMIDMSNASCLRDKLEICNAYQDCTNTDIKAVFDLILNTAIEHDLTQEELPQNVLIVSDMEFDYAIFSRWDTRNESNSNALFEQIKEIYKVNGYKMPRLIFWNVCSTTNTIPLQENEAGVALVSGFNPAVYNMVLSDELDPYKCLLNQINSDRYDAVERALTA